MILVLVVIVAALYVYSVTHPNQPFTATSTPSGSYAARNIPINQLTGADWLTMSFAERGRVIDAATQRIHCPSAVTKNDLNIAVTQAADTQAGRSQKVIDLLAVLFGLDGCVTG